MGLSIATPEKYASGIPALDTFLHSKEYTENQVVVGMTGFYGQDQPRQWLILVRDIDTADLLQEFVVSEGKVQTKRKIKKLPNQDLPSLPIPRHKLRVDSDVIFTVAEELATAEQIGYDSVHYQLRCREENLEPVWMVNLLDPNRKSVGIHYISALTGQILRSVWHRSSPGAISELDKGPDGKPVSLLYGGRVTEINVSGKTGRRLRTIERVISPSSSR